MIKNLFIVIVLFFGTSAIHAFDGSEELGYRYVWVDNKTSHDFVVRMGARGSGWLFFSVSDQFELAKTAPALQANEEPKANRVRFDSYETEYFSLFGTVLKYLYINPYERTYSARPYFGYPGARVSFKNENTKEITTYTFRKHVGDSLNYVYIDWNVNIRIRLEITEVPIPLAERVYNDFMDTHMEGWLFTIEEISTEASNAVYNNWIEEVENSYYSKNYIQEEGKLFEFNF